MFCFIFIQLIYFLNANDAANDNNPVFQGVPTLYAKNPFQPSEDAQALRDAMLIFGTDEDTIVEILSKRTNSQRIEIASHFKVKFGVELIDELKSETSGSFRKLIVALMTPLPRYYAKEIHHAINGSILTDKSALDDVLFTVRTNNEIVNICDAYLHKYGRPIELDLKKSVWSWTGGFRRLIVTLCSGIRDESMITNHTAAPIDAKALYNAAEQQFLTTEENVYSRVFSQRSFAQLQLILREFHRLSGNDIKDSIRDEFAGDLRNALITMVEAIHNQPAYFAHVLNKSMDRYGTNDRLLIRTVATRCEVDMSEIKKQYEKKYGCTLADDIKSDTYGNYQTLLLRLIGEK